jgi:hypothetical protein
MTEVILDLGECGQVIVDSTSDPSISSNGATEQMGLRDTLRQAGKKIEAGAVDLLKLPLTGLAKVFLTSLPVSSGNEPYELDQFTVEFNLGIKAEAGSSFGAVAKIMPEGAFKCTYVWKRKANFVPPELK